MLAISFRPEARDEYVAACRWYEERQPGLGIEFESFIEERLRVLHSRMSAACAHHSRWSRMQLWLWQTSHAGSLCERPEMYPVVAGDIREATIRRFPYAIYFRVCELGIRVLAVFHNSRDPIEWKSRIDP